MDVSREHVADTIVADSGAFLRNAALQSIGRNIFSLPEVVNEIRDKATRQRLQVLPYEIQYRQPSVESIKFVTEFSKKTGDYSSLSAVDIRVMALTYQLEKEVSGDAHIKKAPEHKAEWTATSKLIEKPTDLAGFYLGKKEVGVVRSRSNTERTSISNETNPSAVENRSTESTSSSSKDVETSDVTKDSEVPASGDVSVPSETSDVTLEDVDDGLADGDVLDEDQMEEGSEDDDEEEEDELSDDDDGGGWITPSNVKSKKLEMMQRADGSAESVKVACLTTDFAMQNVLLQMGLNVISVDGLLIKQARSFVLRCHACMKVTKIMTKQFCPHCGNHTLKKVSVSVNEDGTLKYYLSKRKPISTRGMRFSLPKPQGGKHAVNPQLCEDQPMPQQRPTKKSLRHMNAMDPDFIANTSPFSTNDVTSRAAMLGIRNGRKNPGFRNPNMNRRGRRK